MRPEEAVTADGPLPPMLSGVLHTDRGDAFIPHAFLPDMHILMPVCVGIGIGWAPVEGDSVLLSLWGGNPATPTDEAVATVITRKGLRDIIRDLQSIDDQLERGE